MPAAEYELRSPGPHDFDAWYALYEPYAVLMGDPVTPAIGRTMWQWVMDPHNCVEAILAFSDRILVGFTHYRPFPRTLHGNDACYLDDLYVAGAHRGTGLAQRLIEAVAAVAKERGWSHVRWVTAEDNLRAQRLYNRIAERIDILTYQLKETT
ncbi:MAG: GNAT family N-acetyltransferase [Candidatus Eremiobacteraeota bacterium]|nr:GNAT family N-acetyltransferase [Candidatus Eremiobacteraeota bacterium]